MDNGAIQSAYDAGVRAYKTHEGVLFYLDTVVNYRMSPAESPSFWHALRAYQDEQRKKGEPINLYIRDWHDRDYEQNEGQFLSYYLSHRDEPQIIVYANSDSESTRIAKFTNFRWRPGHGPKESISMAQDVGDCSVPGVHGHSMICFDKSNCATSGCRRKGSSNG